MNIFKTNKGWPPTSAAGYHRKNDGPRSGSGPFYDDDNEKNLTIIITTGSSAASPTPTMSIALSGAGGNGTGGLDPVSKQVLGPLAIATVIGYIFLIVVTVSGNLLVIGAFFRDPTLQAITNYWIISLALTDIILASTVMPLQVNRELTPDQKWNLGPFICDVFICLDVLNCTCSIYHLGLISLDRYLCVRFPIHFQSFSYMIISSLISFYIPLFICLAMYYGVFRVTRTRSKKLKRELLVQSSLRAKKDRKSNQNHSHHKQTTPKLLPKSRSQILVHHHQQQHQDRNDNCGGCDEQGAMVAAADHQQHRNDISSSKHPLMPTNCYNQQSQASTTISMSDMEICTGAAEDSTVMNVDDKKRSGKNGGQSTKRKRFEHQGHRRQTESQSDSDSMDNSTTTPYQTQDLDNVRHIDGEYYAAADDDIGHHDGDGHVENVDNIQSSERRRRQHQRRYTQIFVDDIRAKIHNIPFIHRRRRTTTAGGSSRSSYNPPLHSTPGEDVLDYAYNDDQDEGGGRDFRLSRIRHRISQTNFFQAASAVVSGGGHGHHHNHQHGHDGGDSAATMAPTAGAAAEAGGGLRKLSRREIQRRKERNAAQKLKKKRQKQENRTAKVVLIVLGSFVVLWLPFFLVNVIWPVCQLVGADDGGSADCGIDDDVWKIVTWLGYCNSAVNPFIYTFFNRTFRRAIFHIIKCDFRGRYYRRRGGGA